MKADPNQPSTALVPIDPPDLAIGDDLRLQKLWLALERRPWRSLAVLGANAGVDTHEICQMLAQLAWRYRGQPSSVCDLRDLSMRLVEYEIAEIGRQLEAGLRLIVSLRSIFENPTSAPISRSVDGVLLCVALGDTKFKAAEETIAAVGRERVVGSIVLSPRIAKPSRLASER